MASVAPLTNKPDAGPKHRACDECRTRKLACSKEPDGCSRCKKENIVCVYSPQKQMGRPRKRRLVVEEGDANAGAATVTQQQINLPDFQLQPTAVYDPNLDFLDTQGVLPNLDFWDLQPGSYQDPSIPQALPLPSGDTAVPETTGSSSMKLHVSGIDLLSSINFDEIEGPAQTTITKDLSWSLHQYLDKHLGTPSESSSTPPDSTPGSEPGVATSESSADTPPPSQRLPMIANPSVSCGCLSSLYLALDSLTRIPDEVPPAMRIARNASRVAHDVLCCPTCYGCSDIDPYTPPPIQGFQNMMLLGALVPSACNAYSIILERVDAEAARAKAEGRSFWFTFKDIGGLWGRVGDESSTCGTIQAYNNREMSPDMWRVTIRALLRLDVYGIGYEGIDNGGRSKVQHMGLKDVVDTIEEHSRRRHNIVDRLMETGEFQKHAHPTFLSPLRPVPHEQRNCTRIIETARLALDNLVIA